MQRTNQKAAKVTSLAEGWHGSILAISLVGHLVHLSVLERRTASGECIHSGLTHEWKQKYSLKQEAQHRR